MSPRRGDRRRISGRQIGGAVAGAAVLLVSIGGLIINQGSRTSIPHAGAKKVKLDLLASRDLGALPPASSWCTLERPAEHCYLFEGPGATQSATDYGTPGGWHLAPNGTARIVTGGPPVLNTSGMVSTATETGLFVDAYANRYLSSSVAVCDATKLSVSFVMTNPPTSNTFDGILSHAGTYGWAISRKSSSQELYIYAAGASSSVSTFEAIPHDHGLHCITAIIDRTSSTGTFFYIDGAKGSTTGDLTLIGSIADTAAVRAGSSTGSTYWPGGIYRMRMDCGVVLTQAQHQSLCGTWAAAPAGGPSDTKPLASDASWTQTGGASCYPVSASQAACQPGGTPRYTVDATGLGWVVEPDATNRVTYNTKVNCTTWTCRGTTSLSAVAAPDGSMTAANGTVGTAGVDDFYGSATGYTNNVTVYPRIWVKCSTGTFRMVNIGGGTGTWEFVCATLSNGSWVLAHDPASQAGLNEIAAWNSGASGQASPRFQGTGGSCTVSIWAPTISEEPGTHQSVIPTGAAAVSTGDPAWMIDNDPDVYWQAGDTVTQTLTAISGSCWNTADATQLYLSGYPGSECSGIWYGLKVTR